MLQDTKDAQMQATKALIERERYLLESNVNGSRLGGATGSGARQTSAEEVLNPSSPQTKRPLPNVTTDEVKSEAGVKLSSPANLAPKIAVEEKEGDYGTRHMETTVHHKAPIYSAVVRHEVDFSEMEATTIHNVYKSEHVAPPPPTPIFVPFHEHQHTKKKTTEKGSGGRSRHEEKDSQRDSHAGRNKELEYLRRRNNQLERERLRPRRYYQVPPLPPVQMMERQWIERKFKRTQETHEGEGARRMHHGRLRGQRFAEADSKKKSPEKTSNPHDDG
eukprot:GHVN01012846.1.p1 GENE.GHVN01012846.1~~GHVN01012846.1.p1  ORF type:complete len:276 (+),score=37.94 GHVN01012846.1:432-1259(+)